MFRRKFVARQKLDVFGRTVINRYKCVRPYPNLPLPVPVVLFRFMDNTKLIQLMSECLVGINMVRILIAARPIKLKSAQ